MISYDARQLAESIRTVRKNTLTIAEEIPAEKYAFRPVPELRSVAELLAHLAVNTGWQMDVHGGHVDFIDFEMFGKRRAEAEAAEKGLTTKDQIVAALRAEGERFAAFVEGLPDETLNERVSFPPPVQPQSRSRFEMMQGAKEHEMH